MGVSKTYIAVIIVLVILIGFILSVIAVLARTAGQRIRIDMNRVLSNYDEIIAKKTDTINELNNNLSDRKYYGGGAANFSKQSNAKTLTITNDEEERIPISAFVKSSSNYRNGSLANGYESIKNAFSYSEKEKKDSIENVKNLHVDNKLAKAANKLANKYSYDKVFSLITKKPEEQLVLLDKELTKDEKELLDNYQNLYGSKRFDAIKFMDWIKRIAKDGSDEVNVRTSTINDENYDPAICDGYQIYVGNKMYDYSISKKEVS